MNVVLNADDFGLSPDVNRAILICFEQRLISSATIMPNMPAFEDAVRLSFANDFVDRIGVHLNLTAGTPLTDPIRQCPAFCTPAGEFRRRRHYLITPSQRRLLSNEVRAQIQRCRDVGLPVTHLDSHHHSHTEPGKFAAIRPVLEEMKIQSVRLSRNVDPLPRHSPRAVWKSVFNSQLRKRNWQSVDYFGCVGSFRRLLAAGRIDNRSIEVECHPGFDSRGRLVDLVEGIDFRSGFRHVIDRIDQGLVVNGVARAA